jgi:tripartite-type tricarboxylate transporter receptor subunit TctC
VIVKMLGLFVVCFALAVPASPASSQPYPSRPVKVIVPLSTGSASDTLTRIVGQKLNDLWGTTVVVENQPGANGIPATIALVRSAPDGYTLLTMAANHVINASLYEKLPFDTLRDVRPIVRIGFTPLILCVHPSVAAANMQELIALAKAKPGTLNFGSAGSGSPTHLAGEMLKTMAGINIQHVPYKAISQAQTDLMSGQLQLMLIVPSFAMQHMAAGRLRALGVGSLKRMPQLPQLPTIDESGIPGYEALPWIGLAGPAGLPDEIVNKISTDVLKVLAMPDVQERVAKVGLVLDGMPASQFSAYVVREQAKWGKTVKDSGARAD